MPCRFITTGCSILRSRRPPAPPLVWTSSSLSELARDGRRVIVPDCGVSMPLWEGSVVEQAALCIGGHPSERHKNAALLNLADDGRCRCNRLWGRSVGPRVCDPQRLALVEGSRTNGQGWKRERAAGHSPALRALSRAGSNHTRQGPSLRSRWTTIPANRNLSHQHCGDEEPTSPSLNWKSGIMSVLERYRMFRTGFGTLAVFGLAIAIQYTVAARSTISNAFDTGCMSVERSITGLARSF